MEKMKITIFLLVLLFLPQDIYCQETINKIFDCGFGGRLDTDVYPNIPLSFDIPSNYIAKFETTTDRFAYIYKSGEIICIYSDWTRRKSWSIGVYEVNETVADDIIGMVCSFYEIDPDENLWNYKKNRLSVMVSLGNSVCLLFNIKKKNIKKYTQIIKDSFKELQK